MKKNQKQPSSRPVGPKKDPRWSFELGKTSFGPFSTSGAKMSSRAVGKQMGIPNPGMVGLGNKAIDIQRPMPRLYQTSNENGNTVDVLVGTDFLATLQTASTGLVPGDIVLAQDISPSAFGATRLSQFAALYQRYRFRKVRFLYEPIANATQSGQLIGYADFDVDNRLTLDTADNINIASAHQGQRPTQIWEPMVFDMGQTLKFTDLFTEAGASMTSDPRLTIQGLFYIIAASTVAGSIPLGNIYVDYEVEFSIPFLSSDSPLLSRESSGVYFGTMDAPQGTYASFVPSTHSYASGPVKAEFQVAGSTIQWQNVSVGDQLVLSWSWAETVTGGANFSLTHNVTFTGTSGHVEHINLGGQDTAGNYFGDYFVVLVANPIGGVVTATWTNSGPLVNATSSSLSWTMAPVGAPVVGRSTRALIRRAPQKKRADDESAKLRSEVNALRISLREVQEVLSSKLEGGGVEKIRLAAECERPSGSVTRGRPLLTDSPVGGSASRKDDPSPMRSGGGARGGYAYSHDE